jgi:hypothetical protein
MGRKATDLNYKIAGLPGMKKISCKTGFLKPVFFLPVTGKKETATRRKHYEKV